MEPNKKTFSAPFRSDQFFRFVSHFPRIFAFYYVAF